MPTTLETARLSLRAPRAADAAPVFAVVSDPAVTHYMVWPTATDLDDAATLIDDMAWGWSSGDDFTYVVVERENGAVVGLVSCQFSEEGAELGYMLRRDRWGQGIATEAGRAVMAAAWRIEDLYRIWAACDVAHGACRRLLERLGMTHEGNLRRRSRRPNGPNPQLPGDDAIYALIRDCV